MSGGLITAVNLKALRVTTNVERPNKTAAGFDVEVASGIVKAEIQMIKLKPCLK